MVVMWAEAHIYTYIRLIRPIEFSPAAVAAVSTAYSSSSSISTSAKEISRISRIFTRISFVFLSLTRVLEKKKRFKH